MLGEHPFWEPNIYDAGKFLYILFFAKPMNLL